MARQTLHRTLVGVVRAACSPVQHTTHSTVLERVHTVADKALTNLTKQAYDVIPFSMLARTTTLLLATSCARSHKPHAPVAGVAY